MAKIILGGYMVRYPLGGMLSNTLQYLIGFKELGHEVYFVEKSGWEGSCFDPNKNVMSNDYVYGLKQVDELLNRFGFENKWCYQDIQGKCHGMSTSELKDIFHSSDLFIDYGSHGIWKEEAQDSKMRVLIDGEPGMTQMKMENKRKNGEDLPNYDYYFTVGQNIGNVGCSIPTVGKQWKTIFHPVCVELVQAKEVSSKANFTTIMNWQSHNPINYNGKDYGQKDIEFKKFAALPEHVQSPCELAVSGKEIPTAQLKSNGWRIRNAQKVTISYDSYLEYIFESRGEFSVCKNIFVETNSGWFSDRSAVYLASGRPVVLQETGFSQHLPCGRGLFAVNTMDEAAEAIDKIDTDFTLHSTAAREIANEYLDATKVLKRLLEEIGIN